MSRTLRHIGFPGLLAICLISVSAQADTEAGLLIDSSLDFAAAGVPADELEGERGGDALSLAQLSEINEHANFQNNNAINNTTGWNAIAHGAFAGSSGISTVIQNTGNNVLIQDALILNISVMQ